MDRIFIHEIKKLLAFKQTSKRLPLETKNTLRIRKWETELHFQIYHNDPVIPKEMKYNLHFGDVRGDVLPPPHGTNTSCSVVKTPAAV